VLRQCLLAGRRGRCRSRGAHQGSIGGPGRGDDRTSGQLAADILVERVTGVATAAVPVEVQVVITDRALLTDAFGTHDETPAHVPGYGTVPAAWARDLMTNNHVQAWMRRLYTHPQDGTLVAMDSTRRLFDGGLRRILVARDGTCVTPWCDAPAARLASPTGAGAGAGAVATAHRRHHDTHRPPAHVVRTAGPSGRPAG
jgi:hypothetical protein